MASGAPVPGVRPIVLLGTAIHNIERIFVPCTRKVTSASHVTADLVLSGVDSNGTKIRFGLYVEPRASRLPTGCIGLMV